MTVQASEQVHSASHDQPAFRQSDGPTAQRAVATTSASFVATIAALPRNVKIIGGAVLVFGTLLAIGVPLATLTPLLALGGCLGMHLFMPGMHGRHGGHDGHDGHQAHSGEGDDASNPVDRREG